MAECTNISKVWINTNSWGRWGGGSSYALPQMLLINPFDEVFFTIQKNLYGVHVMLNAKNTEQKTESEILQDIKGDWRTSVTVNKLTVNIGSIVADMNLTLWEYFKDLYNSKVIEIMDLDPSINYYGLLDNMYDYQNNEKTDSKTILLWERVNVHTISRSTGGF